MFKFNKKVYITILSILILSISCKNNITDGNQNTNDLGNYAGVYKSATYDINIGSDGSITVAESGAQSITGSVSSKEGNKYTIKLDNGTQIIIEFLDNGSVTITKPDGTTESATKNENNTGGEHVPQMITVYCGSNSIDIDINSDYSQKIKDLWLSVFANKKVYALKSGAGGHSAIIRQNGDYQHNFDGLAFKYIASSIYSLPYKVGASETNYTNYVVGVYSNAKPNKTTLPHCIFFVEGDDNKVRGMYVSNTITIAEAISNQDKTKNNWWDNETGFRYKGFLKDN